MYDTGKAAQVTKEMRIIRIQILANVDEHKTQTGHNYMSGRNDDQHHGGVTMNLRKGLRNYLMEWKPISERHLDARFKGKQST